MEEASNMQFAVIWYRAPNTPIVSYASSIVQNDVGSFLLVCITLAVGVCASRPPFCAEDLVLCAGLQTEKLQRVVHLPPFLGLWFQHPDQEKYGVPASLRLHGLFRSPGEACKDAVNRQMQLEGSLGLLEALSIVWGGAWLMEFRV